ncbi:hypothetical protein PAXRUDRAFT_832891, partial [Paxillus rubicundulus Ve08.2h10]
MRCDESPHGFRAGAATPGRGKAEVRTPGCGKAEVRTPGCGKAELVFRFRSSLYFV